MAAKRGVLKPEAFPFRIQCTSAQMRAAKQGSGWMSTLCTAIAEACGIDGDPNTPHAWMGAHPSGRAELGAKLHSVRTIKPSGRDPHHRITIELAAFNAKGECIAWNEGPIQLTFRERGRVGGLVLLSDPAKRALADLTRKGRAVSKPEVREPPKRAKTKRTSAKRSRSKPAALRPAFEAKFEALAKRGIHFERLHYGRPAAAASLDKIEAKILGGPMDPSLRSFFLEMDGLACCYWVDPLSPGVVREVPKPRVKKRLSWQESTDAFSPLWKKIRGIHEAWAEADCPKRADGETFVLGLINIPDHKTMFKTAWDDMLCLEPGEFLFDANHHYRGEYLAYELDPDTQRQTSLVVEASDSFAARYDNAGVTVSRYLRGLVKRAGRVEV